MHKFELRRNTADDKVNLLNENIKEMKTKCREVNVNFTSSEDSDPEWVLGK